jgi:hypothetical protein
MILLQATQGDHGFMTWGPMEWGIFFVGLSGFIASIWSLFKSNNAQNTSNTNTQNTQTLAAGQAILAGKLRQSPSVSNPPPSVENSALQIAADPSSPAPLPEGLAMIVQEQQEGTDT